MSRSTDRTPFVDVPPTVPEVLAEVESTAQRLLAAFQAPEDRHQSFSCSP